MLARAPERAFERYAIWSILAAGGAWLIGFGLFAAVLLNALSATVVEEVIFSYPPAPLVAACWAFAAAAVLTLAALPGLAVIARPNGWSILRRAIHGLAAASFTASAITLWGLGFLGFSGW